VERTRLGPAAVAESLGAVTGTQDLDAGLPSRANSLHFSGVIPTVLRDLLVCVDQTECAATRLRLAVDLAYRHGSRLTALYVRERTPAQLHQLNTAELGLASGDQLDRVNQSIEHSIDVAEHRLRSFLEFLKKKRRLAAELRSVDGLASTVVPEQARYADLCIVAARDEPAEDDSVAYTFAERLLFVTGRPVMFIPASNPSDTLGRHIVIAWNSSRVATRAINDALPLIERAEQTTVIAINPSRLLRAIEISTDQILEHLRSHTESVQAIQLSDIPTRRIGDSLQAEARTLGADLIVAGAFGHPRFWENLLGGVTQDLLDRMTMPILMSH
jgi:nucleotide-binding universal stress UspA family protein